MNLRRVLIGVACAMGIGLGPVSAATDESRVTESCRQDSDCKLIYSSCACAAVRATDARGNLDDDHGIECAQNVCRTQKAIAICSAGMCAREPASNDALRSRIVREAASRR